MAALARLMTPAAEPVHMHCLFVPFEAKCLMQCCIVTTLNNDFTVSIFNWAGNACPA
jgi:hypothetical protein